MNPNKIYESALDQVSRFTASPVNEMFVLENRETSEVMERIIRSTSPDLKIHRLSRQVFVVHKGPVKDLGVLFMKETDKFFRRDERRPFSAS